MASAAALRPHRRLQSSTKFLLRLRQSEQMNSSYIVDEDFDDVPNCQPLTSEGLDHLIQNGR